MAAVAVVGLGVMGGRIARRLVDAGHDVVVWNRDARKAGPLVDAGATRADTPAAAASSAEVAIVMVSGPHALAAVTEGPDGVVAGAAGATTVIQMSTVAPASVERLASLLPEGALLDAPVLGSLPEAEAGTLRIFAGGPEALVRSWTPLLSALGTVVPVGGLGAGTAAKLVANSTLFGALGVLGESLALARALGLSQETAFEVLSASPLASQAERRRPAVESGEYEPRFALSLALKDADLVRDVAGGAGLDLRLAEAARSWLAEADADGWGERDYSELLARILDENAG